MSKMMDAVQRAAAERELSSARGQAYNRALLDEAQRVESSILNWSARAAIAVAPGASAAKTSQALSETLQQALARSAAKVRECEQQIKEHAAALETLKAQAAHAAQSLAASQSACEEQRKRLEKLQAAEVLSQAVTRAEEELESLRAQLRQALAGIEVRHVHSLGEPQ